MWVQLALLEWPAAAVNSLRYFTNSGGAMPRATLATLRRALPKTTPFLMYGLTEAFRSTYLPRRKSSAGRIRSARPSPMPKCWWCARMARPARPANRANWCIAARWWRWGYWNDPIKTVERFRPAPGQNPGLPLTELAVWSGDTVRADEEGFLYFIGRKDDMIKTSGYRVSPTEVEEVLYGSGQVVEAAALGIPHPMLGQAVVAVVKPLCDDFNESELITRCKQHLPNFMVPLRVIVRRDDLPRNPNGKIDRKAWSKSSARCFRKRLSEDRKGMRDG